MSRFRTPKFSREDPLFADNFPKLLITLQFTEQLWRYKSSTKRLENRQHILDTQRWKLEDDEKLKNKKGQGWPDSWDFVIEANGIKIRNKAMSTEFFGSTITASGLQVLTNVDSNSALLWIKGDEDADGYFTLTLSTKTHLHLTYTDSTPHNILTMEGQKWANPYGTYEWNIEDLGEEGFIHADFDGE